MNRLVFFIFFALSVKEVASQQLTLDTAIAIALRNSPGLMISKNNVEISGLNNSYGMAGGLPLIQGTSNVTQQITSLEQKLAR